MKADATAQGRLLDLQATDTAMAQLDHRRATLPETATARGLQADRARAAERLIAADTVLSDAELELKKAEQDLVPVRERLARNETRVADGSVGDPKALQGMLEEIEHLKRRIDELEDNQLAAMEHVDESRAVAESVRADKTGVEDEMRAVLAIRESKLAELAAERDVLVKERDVIAAVIPADLLALYTRIAEKSGGVGAAKLQHGRCGGCQLEANNADMSAYRAAAADDVIRCEECGRILVRAADSGL